MDTRALDFVAPHCDIRERLLDVPPEARVRGVAWRSIASALQVAGKLEDYEQQLGSIARDSIAFYPLADYMVSLASASAVLTAPERLYEGMAEISRNNARYLSASLLGQALIHALASDPLSLLEQGLAMRRQTKDYGRWELVHHGPRDVEVRYFDEYVWIEQAHRHAAAGTFDACSIKPNMVTKLLTPYSGSTRFQW
jgi:uncharacterized protein (TIGR02265 family)